ncbi:LysR family transcriptional regulator [Saccharopolyspora pogona]|uniref:LysR family transcriptional regulator n=1 Tax=Saccharopolyspora pogona TaxID=333966 RepID=UPI0016845B68|nr:LysR family transcriptional regulator [Saccharopolyspora pogona]
MDVRQLECFLAIVEHNGFGRAAHALHIAQPSLSQTIAGLERELGVQLFHRIGRGVVLSNAGTELIEPASQVLRDMRTARATMDSLKGVQRGRVELVTISSAGIEPLGTLTRLFTQCHPGVTVAADAAFTPEEVVQKVKQGSCELGLVGAQEDVQAPGVDVLPLEAQDFVLVGAADTDFPSGNPIQRSALVGARLIVSPPGSLMRQIVDEVLASGTDLEIVAEVAHRTSILPLVMQGIGVAVLPSAWAPMARRLGALVARIAPPTQLHISLLSRQAPLTPAAQAFLAVARSYRPGSYIDAEQLS